MANKTLALSFIALLFIATGCTRTATSPAGFRLPDGDPANGRVVFVAMQCHQCHTIAGENFPEIPNADPPYVQLGGTVSRVKTYGELVSAIINPSHKLADGYAAEQVSDNGVSKMPVYNDYMTVRELTDLVVYLQPNYNVVVPQHHYPPYY